MSTKTEVFHAVRTKGNKLIASDEWVPHVSVQDDYDPDGEKDNREKFCVSTSVLGAIRVITGAQDILSMQPHDRFVIAIYSCMIDLDDPMVVSNKQVIPKVIDAQMTGEIWIMEKTVLTLDRFVYFRHRNCFKMIDYYQYGDKTRPHTMLVLSGGEEIKPPVKRIQLTDSIVYGYSVNKDAELLSSDKRNWVVFGKQGICIDHRSIDMELIMEAIYKNVPLYRIEYAVSGLVERVNIPQRGYNFQITPIYIRARTYQSVRVGFDDTHFDEWGNLYIKNIIDNPPL